MERGWNETGLLERGRSWLVVRGSRLTIAGLTLGVVLLVMGTLTVGGILPGSPDDPLYFLFSALLGGNLTLITVVISINQLVLSRELGSPGELRRRMEAAMEFRDEAGTAADRPVGPVRPDELLFELHESLGERAATLEETIADHGDQQLASELEPLFESVRGDVRDVNARLDATDAGPFAAIAATLGTTHADQLEELDRVRAEPGTELPDEARSVVASIRDHLLHIDVARNYLRTIYVEQELALLSRVILYVGAPVQIAVAATLALYAGPDVVPAAVYALVVPIAVTAGFAPLAVLFSYVLRLSWIAERNVAIVPFTTIESRVP